MGPTSRNLVQAFAVFFGAFVFPSFLALSLLNQQLRKVVRVRVRVRVRVSSPSSTSSCASWAPRA